MKNNEQQVSHVKLQKEHEEQWTTSKSREVTSWRTMNKK